MVEMISMRKVGFLVFPFSGSTMVTVMMLVVVNEIVVLIMVLMGC